MSFLQLDRRGLLLTVGLVGVLLLPSLHSDFIWDDHRQIVEAPAMGELSAIPGYFTDSLQQGIGDSRPAAEALDLYRPAFVSLLSLQYALAGGAHPGLFHFTSLALHLLVLTLLGLAMRRWVTSSPLGLAGLLFFGLHPVTAEAVLFISAQSELTLTAGLLGAGLLLDPREGRTPSWRAATAAGACVALAAFSKESGLILAPALGLFLVRCRGCRWERLAPSALACAVVLALRLIALGGLRTGGEGDLPGALHNLPLLLADGLRALLTMQPIGLRHLSWDYEELGFGWVLGASIATLAVAGLCAAVRRSAPLLPWSFALFLVALGPAALITTVDGWGGFGRYLYVPLAAAVLGGVQGLQAVARHPRWRAGRGFALGIALVLLLEAWLIQGAQQDWQDDEALGLSAVRLRPEQGVGYTWVAQALQRGGGCEPALPWYQASVHRDPDYHPGFQNLVICLVHTGRSEDALTTVDALEARHGVGPKSGFARALALSALDRRPESRAVAERALKGAPGDPDLLWVIEQLDAREEQGAPQGER